MKGELCVLLLSVLGWGRKLPLWLWHWKLPTRATAEPVCAPTSWWFRNLFSVLTPWSAGSPISAVQLQGHDTGARHTPALVAALTLCCPYRGAQCSSPSSCVAEVLLVWMCSLRGFLGVLLLSQILMIISSFYPKGGGGNSSQWSVQGRGISCELPWGLCLLWGVFLGLPAALESRTDLTFADYGRM